MLRRLSVVLGTVLGLAVALTLPTTAFAQGLDLSFSSAIWAQQVDEFQTRSMEIDVKPGSDPNPVNCKQLGRRHSPRGVIAVAILSDVSQSPSFEPATRDLDPSSAVLSTGLSTATESGEAHGRIHNAGDLNGDALSDLVLHFRTVDLFDDERNNCSETDLTLTVETADASLKLIGNRGDRTVVPTPVGNGPPGALNVEQMSLAMGPHGLNLTVQGQAVEGVRLQVHSLSGRPIFDSGFVSGNSLRWGLLDRQGQAIANGVYLSVATVQGPDGETAREVRKVVILR